jgi:putative ABC transport system ATP-binding protein
MTPPRIELKGVAKSYATPAGERRVLHDLDLAVAAGESLAITGRSGSGKSTLLHLLAGIDRPTRGEVVVAATAIHAATERFLSRWRGVTVGFVFQFFQLLPTLTTVENVMLPMDFCGTGRPRERRRRALELLRRVGLDDHADQLPATLSGGQQQRAAIARALANDPPVVLADEPTGNLDAATAAPVLELFTGLARRGTTVVIATHDRAIAGRVDRTLELVEGRLDGGLDGRAAAR